MSTVITLSEVRSIDTPAARMQTYVSPTMEVDSDLAVWRTVMEPGSAGPTHTVDRDHVVVVVNGRLHAEVGGEEAHVGPGDCILLSAMTPRRLTAGPDGVTTITAALPGSTARAGDAEPVAVPWAN